MKAMYYTEYGPPEVLEMREIEKPIPGPDEVLVRVRASSINSWDENLLTGRPRHYRMWGFLRPRYPIGGADFAGTVESVGDNVTAFKPGEKVYGDLCDCGWGGFAQYVAVPQKAVVAMPASLSFEEAAAMPQAAGISLLGIRDYRKVSPGKKVLINGAGGGMGTFAIQFAKYFGGEVTAVDSTPKLEKMKSLGADHVIDYTRDDFTRLGKTWDLIFDVSACHSFFDYRRALSPEGLYLVVGGSTRRLLQIITLGSLFSLGGSKSYKILPHTPNINLHEMEEIMKQGNITPCIDRIFSLEELPEAFHYFAEGAFSGKIVISIP